MMMLFQLPQLNEKLQVIMNVKIEKDKDMCLCRVRDGAWSLILVASDFRCFNA